MLDTFTLLVYLFGNDPGRSSHLQLQIKNRENQKVTCVTNARSPALQWQGVPPDANSLALMIKDQNHYEWVVYNLPPDLKKLPYGANTEINAHNIGMNSWGQRNYHATCSPVTVELYALDKRFSAREIVTGETLEKKIQGHILDKKIIRE